MNTQTVPSDIPDKLYFKIGEVCDLVGVQAHVLRYWESEFPSLAPQKNRAGQRTYRRKDVEMALRIKELLYGEGFTIAGAKRKLVGEGRSTTARFKVVPPTTSHLQPNVESPPYHDDFANHMPASLSANRPVSRDTLQRLRLMLEDMLTTLNRNVLD
ncbi:MAG: MerR family transcriptional regulator [Acidobacteria bacterium]|nr:MerR family transcriptional regulator [Acidobacteriota bacterium]MBI3428225.1 MerR family transcriptional regulator [Acidobacteriota bacterium]